MSIEKSIKPDEISSIYTNAVENASKVTLLINSRKRLPISGVLLSDELVLSVDHGIEKEEDIAVFLGSERRIAKLIGRDHGLDLAVLKIDSPLPFSAYPNEDDARVGEPIFAVGRPEFGHVQASFGIITAIGQSLRTMRGGILERYYATSATPYPGFSGGPLVNLSGNVVGINTSGLIGGISLAIPFDVARAAGLVLAKHGRLRRGYIGMRSQPVDLPDAVQTSLNIKQKTGLLIVGLEDKGAGVEGGLLIGDIVISIQEHPVVDQETLMQVLGKEEIVGRQVPFDIIRGGQRLTLPIVIGERK